MSRRKAQLITGGVNSVDVRGLTEGRYLRTLNIDRNPGRSGSQTPETDWEAVSAATADVGLCPRCKCV